MQEDSKGVDVALSTEYGVEEGDQELVPQEAKKYRSLAATVNFSAPGPDDGETHHEELGQP